MQRETAVANTVPKEGGASRAVANVIAESDLEGTKADVVGMVENDIGITPQPGQQQNRVSAQNSAGADVAEDDVYRFEDFTPEELDQVKTEYEKLGMDPLPVNRGPEAFNRIPMEKRKALFDAIRTRGGDAATASATASATDDNNGIKRLIELEAANQSGPRRRRGGPIPDNSELTQLRSQYSPKEVEAYQLRQRVNRRGRKDSQWQAAKERLTQLESEIAAEKQSAIAPDDPALAEQLTAFADEIADLPPEEIDEGVANGKIKVSSEVASAVADKLQENDIRNVRDLKRLNIRDRAIARAVIIASPGVPDQIRIRYAQEMSNLFETGVPSISAAQSEANRIAWAQIDNSNENTQLRKAEFERGVRNDSVEQEGKARKIITDNTEKGVGFLQQTRDIFQPEDDKGRRPSSPILTRDRANAWVTQAFPEQLYEIDASQTKFERGRLIKAMNQGISYTLAALASDGDAGLKEAFLSWFRPNTEGNVNPADFDIQRVRMVTNNSGNPVSFYYVDARGNRTGTAVPARAVQNISEDLYQALFEAANHYGSEQE
jgi:hypothetical protein